LEQPRYVEMQQTFYTEIMSLAHELVATKGIRTDQAINKAADMVLRLEQFVEDWDAIAYANGVPDVLLF
jgi:hypothetical protein